MKLIPCLLIKLHLFYDRIEKTKLRFKRKKNNIYGTEILGQITGQSLLLRKIKRWIYSYVKLILVN